MKKSTDAYLDIETTGLSPSYHEITVIGIYLADGTGERSVQLVGEQINTLNILEALEGVDTIFTYNGSRFDLPFIHRHIGLDLAEMYKHCDLMHDCWRRNLKGGLKAVERQLGIPRKLQGLGGYDAVVLWRRYRNYDDESALAMLLQYNREDIINLKVLRELL